MGSHALEGETDDDRGVEAYAQFQKQQSTGAGLLDEFLIATCLLVPMGILNKGVIAAEVHRHGLTIGRMGNQLSGDATIFDEWQHLVHPFLVMIQFFGRARCGLEVGIIAGTPLWLQESDG